MSEHEQEVLERLEQEFQPSSPVGAPSRWPRVSREKRLAAAGVMVPVGLFLLCVAVALSDAGGAALAVLGYLLVVGGSALLVKSTASLRVERPARRATRPLRFLQ